MIVFDIETGPLENLPPLDRSTVKLGNLKDPEQIEAKYAEAERQHVERAALSATTGRVLAIGVHEGGDGAETRVLGDGGGEAAMLACFWNLIEGGETVVGFNSHGFDLPFVCRRSLVHGLGVPAWTVTPRGYFNDRYVDLLNLWRFGNRQEFVSLNEIAAAFGLAGKLDGVSGADFAKLWESDREKAVAYLRRDVELTRELALAMGV